MATNILTKKLRELADECTQNNNRQNLMAGSTRIYSTDTISSGASG